MKFRLIVLVLALSLFLAACGGASSSAGIKIDDLWVRSSASVAMVQSTTPMASDSGMSHGGGSNSAAYMIIRNTGKEADRLVKAESSVANAVELHESKMVDGVMTMQPVEGIEIPVGGQAELKPGGYHVMLIGLKQDLLDGNKVTLVLHFEKSGTITVEAEVRTP